MGRCHVFTVTGAYGRFRKPYTTTSALTYASIHPPAAKGLIGAFLGIKRLEFYDLTKKWNVAIEVHRPIVKSMQTVKLQSAKRSESVFGFPSNVEFLRDLKYVLYIRNMQDFEVTQTPVFTPYLGCSEYIAKVTYEGQQEVFEKFNFENTETRSVVPFSEISLKFDQETSLVTEKLPVSINQRREYDKYENVLIPNGGLIRGNGVISNTVMVNQRIIYFFN